VKVVESLCSIVHFNLFLFFCFREEQKELIRKEDHYRQLFAEDPNNPELRDPHLMLIDVFENKDLFNYAEETPEEVSL
jgi:hypothetical protein